MLFEVFRAPYDRQAKPAYVHPSSPSSPLAVSPLPSGETCEACDNDVPRHCASAFWACILQNCLRWSAGIMRQSGMGRPVFLTLLLNHEPHASRWCASWPPLVTFCRANSRMSINPCCEVLITSHRSLWVLKLPVLLLLCAVPPHLAQLQTFAAAAM